MFATEIQTDVRDIAAALRKASETAVNELKAGAAVVPTLGGLYAKRAATVPLRDFASPQNRAAELSNGCLSAPRFKDQRKRSC